MAGPESRRQADQKKERAIELIGKGLPTNVISQRLGLRSERINQIRKEISEAK